MTKSEQRNRNAEIALFMKNRVIAPAPWTLDEIAWIQTYAGDGGMGLDTRGILFEFYTPHELVSRMWGLAHKYGFTGGDILEPSCGIGRFLQYVDPSNSSVDAYEFSKDNDTSFQIAKASYPWANISCDYFESIFYGGTNKRVGTSKRYDLVIGNPPYSKFSGYYAANDYEGKIFPGVTYDQYFIWAGVELLKAGGLLIFIIPSTFLDNKTNYNTFKEGIAEKADLLDAYRCPMSVFEFTQTQTDIIVLRKR